MLGCFGIRVVTGEVTIAGATLRSSENIFWVYAPHCLAMPVIRTTQDSRLRFHNDTNSIHLKKLGRLSPLFKRLWNEPAEANDDAGKRSFRFVCARERIVGIKSHCTSISDPSHRLEPRLMSLRNV